MSPTSIRLDLFFAIVVEPHRSLTMINARSFGWPNVLAFVQGRALGLLADLSPLGLVALIEGSATTYGFAMVGAAATELR